MVEAPETRLVRTRTLTSLVPAAVRAYGVQVAVRAPWRGELESVSYAELDRRSAEARDVLRTMVSTQDHVVISGANSIPWVVAFFGVIRAGAIPVPLDPCLDADRRDAILAEVRPVAILADRRVLQGLGRTSASRFELGSAMGSTSTHDPTATADAEPDEDDVAVLIHTTGTTGAPKGVMLTHRNLVVEMEAVVAASRPAMDDALFLTLPLYHAFALTVGLLSPIAAGVPVDLEPRLTHIGRRLTESHPTIIVGVPALFEVLVREVRRRAKGPRRLYLRAALATNRALIVLAGVNAARFLLRPVRAALGGRLRFAVSGGAPLAVETIRQAHALGIPLLQGYGLTEAGPVVSVQRFSSRRFWWSRFYWRRAGSLGPPVPCCTVRIEAVPGLDAPDGEIVVSGDNVMAGYFRNEALTRETLRAGSLFTGDIGHVDGDGELHVTGRLKLAVSTPSGKLVHLERVEAAIGAAPEVEQIRVVDEPGPPWRLVAIVYPSVIADSGGTVDAATMLANVRRAVAIAERTLLSYERVAEVRLVDAPLPLTPLGKLRRGAPPSLAFDIERWRTSIRQRKVE